MLRFGSRIGRVSTHWSIGLVLAASLWSLISLFAQNLTASRRTGPSLQHAFYLYLIPNGVVEATEAPSGATSFADPSRYLGSVSTLFRYERSGVLAPTRGHWTVLIMYRPNAATVLIPEENQDRVMDQIVVSLDEWLEWTGYDVAMPTGETRDAIRPLDRSPSAEVPAFDTHWQISDARAQSRVLWWGWALNVWAIVNTAWFVLCARRALREKPWKQLTRERMPWECARCGYDLRTLDPSEPCPECGRLNRVMS